MEQDNQSEGIPESLVPSEETPAPAVESPTVEPPKPVEAPTLPEPQEMPPATPPELTQKVEDNKEHDKSEFWKGFWTGFILVFLPLIGLILAAYEYIYYRRQGNFKRADGVLTGAAVIFAFPLLVVGSCIALFMGTSVISAIFGF